MGFAGIRRAILEGDIDKALKLTQAYYPHVLKDNEQVYFKLKCRKFIEMVRKAAELKLVGGSMKNGHTHIDMGAQAMDLDTNGDENGAWGAMDTESASRISSDIEELEERTMAYGQALSDEFGSDNRREVVDGLRDIYSLMAYDDPFSAPTKHLLDRKERVAVAEELNSAILCTCIFLLRSRCVPRGLTSLQRLWADPRGRRWRSFSLKLRSSLRTCDKVADREPSFRCRTSSTASPSLNLFEPSILVQSSPFAYFGASRSHQSNLISFLLSAIPRTSTAAPLHITELKVPHSRCTFTDFQGQGDKSWLAGFLAFRRTWTLFRRLV
jgi:CTLH/CRA C-terminal to LisH motif domain